jgi:threonine dehydrogenase-like Zn-dependent dehydrogenase
LLHQHGIATVLLTDWRPRPADVVVEATGSTAGLQLAMQSLRPRGTLVLKSTVAAAHSLSLAPLVIHEITVVGSRCGRFPLALHALEQQRVAVVPLIDRVYAWRNGLEAVAHAARPGTLKILLRL